MPPFDDGFTADELRDLINDDPKSLGTAADFTPGEDATLEAKLNDASYPTAFEVPNDPIDSEKFMELIDGDEASVVSQPQWSLIQSYMTPGRVQIGSENVQTAMLNIFTLGQMPITHAAIIAAGKRKGSVVEHAFGTGKRCTAAQIIYLHENPEAP